jgi:hypothetical protein
MKSKDEQLEDLQMVEYKMDAEGFHYCFACYSDFEEVDDPKFHELRLAYLKAADELETYVSTQIRNLEETEE